MVTQPGSGKHPPERDQSGWWNRHTQIIVPVITGVFGVIAAVVTGLLAGVHAGPSAAPAPVTVYLTPTAPAAPIGSDAPTSTSGTAAGNPSPAQAATPASQPLTGLTVIGDTELGFRSVTVDGTTYPHALSTTGTQCDGVSYATTYQTNRKYSHFHALVGVTDDSDNGAAAKVFISSIDSDTPIGNSAIATLGQAPVPIDVTITGAFRIDLNITGAVPDDGCANATVALINPVVS